MKTERVEIKFLSGIALDYAVAEKMGYRPDAGHDLVGVFGPWLMHPPEFSESSGIGFCPSRKWAHCGPLIEEERMEFCRDCDGGFAVIKEWVYGEIYSTYPSADTHLEAACRAIVAKRSMTSFFEIPSVLLEIK